MNLAYETPSSNVIVIDCINDPFSTLMECFNATVTPQNSLEWLTFGDCMLTGFSLVYFTSILAIFILKIKDL